jgi:hypothetical protein
MAIPPRPTSRNNLRLLLVVGQLVIAHHSSRHCQAKTEFSGGLLMFQLKIRLDPTLPTTPFPLQDYLSSSSSSFSFTRRQGRTCTSHLAFGFSNGVRGSLIRYSSTGKGLGCDKLLITSKYNTCTYLLAGFSNQRLRHSKIIKL